MTYKLEYPVSYEAVDPFKVAGQAAARTTDKNIERVNLSIVEASRGESAFAIDLPDRYIVFTVEGLGTKNRIADALRVASGEEHYSSIAHCLVATFANDALTLGAELLVVGSIVDAGDSIWFSDERRYRAFCEGFATACSEIGAVWGPGESAHLKGLVMPGCATLNGACVGQIMPKDRLTLTKSISAGDRIILLPSSGLHANYLAAAYDLAAHLPGGLQTLLGDGTTYGHALLAKTNLYHKAVQSLYEGGIQPKYMINITGHGWRKLMRATANFRYIVEAVPSVPEIFDFIQRQGNLTAQEAYGYMNMGAGFALIVSPEEAASAVTILNKHHPGTINSGYVKAGPKAVVIEPVGVEYAAEDLSLR